MVEYTDHEKFINGERFKSHSDFRNSYYWPRHVYHHFHIVFFPLFSALKRREPFHFSNSVPGEPQEFTMRKMTWTSGSSSQARPSWPQPHGLPPSHPWQVRTLASPLPSMSLRPPVKIQRFDQLETTSAEYVNCHCCLVDVSGNQNEILRLPASVWINCFSAPVRVAECFSKICSENIIARQNIIYRKKLQILLSSFFLQV